MRSSNTVGSTAGLAAVFCSLVFVGCGGIAGVDDQQNPNQQNPNQLTARTVLKSTSLSEGGSAAQVGALKVNHSGTDVQLTPLNVSGEILTFLFATKGRQDEGISVFGDLERPDTAWASAPLYPFDLGNPPSMPITTNIMVKPGFVGGTSEHAVAVFGYADFELDVAGNQQVVRVYMVDRDSIFRLASVATGTRFTCGVGTVGEAYCWGENTFSQLGDLTTFTRNTPVPVSGGHSWASVEAGGGEHACGVTTASEAYCWGRNNYGEFGDGTLGNSQVPVLVSGGHSWASVSPSYQFTCGVTTAGEAYCWGLNGYGQLGDGTGAQSLVPVLVSGGHNWASVTTGVYFACGVTTAGEAYCWGSDDYGELGDGGTNTNSLVPVLVSGGHSWASVNAARSRTITGLHACGVTTAGEAYCWGNNGRGELGDGTLTERDIPVLVSGGHNWASVTAGGKHSCGVTTAGDAYCWGFNWFGQLGDGTGGIGTWHTTPQLVSGGLSWASVDGGNEHTCGVTTAGEGYCWGNNSSAELGTGYGPAPPGSNCPPGQPCDWRVLTPVPLGSPWAVKRGDKLLWDGQGSWQWYDMDNQTFTLTRPGNPAVIEVIRDFTDPVHPLLQHYPLNIFLDQEVTLDPQVVTTSSGVDAVVNFSMGFAVTLVGQTTSNVTDDVLITSFSLTQVIANWADSGLQAAATLAFW